ncbi:Hsp70 family protein [Virgisporangium ochraceum]|uniref:Hsp70 family protein n=1 Tax=Virgisporangium ochraceum TaxID=65505 RepID=UPI001944CCFA|nr:Hsp70 family protein [Virgisporangium ochraceum]
MPNPSPYRLAVDFGTSTTVAMVQRPDGPIRPLLFDGSPLLPSAVLLDPAGTLHTGRDAVHLARRWPECLEPNPKRRVDEGSVLLGERAVEVVDLVAAVLRRVAVEAAQVGGPPDEVVLTRPVGWGPVRCGLLTGAAARAGMAVDRLVPEPVGAARYFAGSGRVDLPVGGHVLTFDLGAGTSDVALLRRGDAGFDVVRSAGLDDLGGLDVDAALVAFLRSRYGQLWHDEVGRRALWDDVRGAKEMLSRTAATFVTVPATGEEVPLGRGQFDELARPALEPAVTLMRRLVEQAGVATGQIRGLFLVGGASRTPLVGTLLHDALGIAPTITDQPELVVAEGALQPEPDRAVPSGAALATGPLPPGPLPPGPLPPGPLSSGRGSGPPSVGAPPAAGGVPPAARGRSRAVPIALVLAGVVAAVVLSVAVLSNALRKVEGTGDGVSAGPTATGARSIPPISPPASILSSPGSASPRYSFDNVSALCPKIDLSPLKPIFEKEDEAPLSSRNPGVVPGTGRADCIRSVHHVPADGLSDSIVTLSFTLIVEPSAADATKEYDSERVNHEKNDAGPTDAPGVGERAFTYRASGDRPGPGSQAFLGLEVRDANLRWSAQIEARRIAEGPWSQAQRTRIESAFLASARQSFTNATTK